MKLDTKDTNTITHFRKKLDAAINDDKAPVMVAIYEDGMLSCFCKNITGSELNVLMKETHTTLLED